MSDKELVRKLYIDLCEASINKDLIKLDEILSDDYVLVHMTGMKQTKEDYLDSVKSGELSYFESKHESIDVNGDDATIIGKTKTLASPFGTSKSWWNLKNKCSEFFIFYEHCFFTLTATISVFFMVKIK